MRCLACRIRHRQKRAEQRQRTAEGLARKAARPFDGKAFKLEKQRRAELRREWRRSLQMQARAQIDPTNQIKQKTKENHEYPNPGSH